MSHWLFDAMEKANNDVLAGRVRPMSSHGTELYVSPHANARIVEEFKERSYFYQVIVPLLEKEEGE